MGIAGFSRLPVGEFGGYGFSNKNGTLGAEPGHSRGGGASLISLWREPMLAGAICFEQVSPLQTPSQNWDAPDRNGDRLFPARPLLIFSAADDADAPSSDSTESSQPKAASDP